MPLSYALDQLAQRWSLDPERLDDLSAATIIRGLTFLSMEAQSQRTNRPNSRGKRGR